MTAVLLRKDVYKQLLLAFALNTCCGCVGSFGCFSENQTKQGLYLVKLDYSLSFALRGKLSHITHDVSVNMYWLTWIWENLFMYLIWISRLWWRNKPRYSDASGRLWPRDLLTIDSEYALIIYPSYKPSWTCAAEIEEIEIKCNAFNFLEAWTLLGCVLSFPDESHCRHKEQKSLNRRQGTQAWGSPSSATDSPSGLN